MPVVCDLIFDAQKGAQYYCYTCMQTKRQSPDSKVNGANMGPTWGRQDLCGPLVGYMNFAIWNRIPSFMEDNKRPACLSSSTFNSNSCCIKQVIWTTHQIFQSSGLTVGGQQWTSSSWCSWCSLQPRNRIFRLSVNIYCQQCFTLIHIRQVFTVRCVERRPVFEPNPHKRHPITHPWGRDMECLL